jgi:hypothetical protein
MRAANCDGRERRRSAWDALASDFDARTLDGITTVVELGTVFATAEQILNGRVRGRTVVNVSSKSAQMSGKGDRQC